LARVLPAPVRPRQAADKVHKLAAVLRAPAEQVYAQLLAPWPDARECIRGGGQRCMAFGDTRVLQGLSSMGERLQYLDAAVYLPDDVLVKVDRATMAVALECRVPLLDHRVMEAAWRLPWSMRVRGLTGKWLARQVLERYLPRRLFARPKSGFSVPLADWLRGGLREWAEAMLDPVRLDASGFLDTGAVRALWQEHLAGRSNRQHALWNVLTFQAWHEHWRK
jgi:asparagine synthase (glutamine-hydrolysing)